MGYLSDRYAIENKFTIFYLQRDYILVPSNMSTQQKGNLQERIHSMWQEVKEHGKSSPKPGKRNLTSSSSGPKKIIIDADPGVDDAMAIIMALYAHKQGLIHVLAITLVKGNTTIDNAEKNILHVLKVFYMDDKV